MGSTVGPQTVTGDRHRQRGGHRVLGGSYSTLVGPATCTFNPATGNAVTIGLPAGTSDQCVQLAFTANSVRNGAQVSELDVFGP